MASSSSVSTAVTLDTRSNQVPADNRSAFSHQTLFQHHANTETAAIAPQLPPLPTTKSVTTPIPLSTATTTTTPTTTPILATTTTAPTQAKTTTSTVTTSTSTKTNTTTTNLAVSIGQDAKEESTPADLSQSQAPKTTTTQPVVAPFTIPIPKPSPLEQISISTEPVIVNTPASPSKPTATTKAGATRAKSAPRKKSTESNNKNEILKPESKPKVSRSKKASILPPNGNNTYNSPTDVKPTTKPETKSRAKGKALANSKQPVNNAPTGLIATLPDLNQLINKNQAPASSPSPSKRKSRSASIESTSTASASPVKRSRKKKTDSQPTNDLQQPYQPGTVGLNSGSAQISSPQFLSSATSHNSNFAPTGTGPLMINTPIPNSRLLQGANPIELQDITRNRYHSPMISPYTSHNDPHSNTSASALTRGTLSRLFTTSSATDNSQQSVDDPAKAFEELRENTWSLLYKCIIEQAQHFEPPLLIGTLYTLRNENDKLVNRIRELAMKRDQLIAMNSRLDLPGLMLTQHLNNTSPSFSSVVSGLINSPKSLPTSSPGSIAIATSKQPPPPSSTPFISIGQQHIPPNSVGHIGPAYGLPERVSPLIGVGGVGSQSHSSLSSIKTSAMSTPSPPIGAMMAHSTSNRAGLITVNPPYNLPNMYPHKNAPLGTNSQTSHYARQ